MASVDTKVNIESSLLVLQEACDSKQFEQTKLGSVCLGVPRGIIEKTERLSDIRDKLNNHARLKRCGLEFLCALLKVVGIAVEELAKLEKHISSKDLELCRNRKDFKFAKLIILLCNDMTDDDFKKFFSLCRGHFQHTILLEKYPTIEKFFHKLIEERKVVLPNNVKDLEKILREGMGKAHSLRHVEEYKRAVGLLQQSNLDQG